MIVAIALGQSLGASIDMAGKSKVTAMNFTNLEDEPDDVRIFSNSCNDNSYDKDQYCRCPPGKRVSVFASKHSNKKEDRVWSLECAKISADRDFDASAPYWDTGYVNEFDKSMDWKGIPSNSFLVGMESYHSNKKEDRRYNFFYQNSEHWILTDCITDRSVNDWDKDMNVVLDSNKVIAGVSSTHSNSKEDRKFYLDICVLTPKCSKLKSVEYYWDDAEESSEIIVAATTKHNQLDSSTADPVTCTISNTQQETLGQSYSYQRTSGQEMTASLEVSASYSWGLGDNGASLAVTAGFSSTWSTEETWARSNEHTFSETNGFKVTYTNTCPAHTYCVQQVTARKGRASVPYKLVAYTEEGSTRNECTEHGNLIVENAWDVESTVYESLTPP
jgi:hypothetical protein